MIMYSDIISLIIIEGFKDDNRKQLILWWNYNMKFREMFVDF